MKAIILAAGVNSRLKDHIDVPKSLLPLGDSTILQNQIDALKKSGLNDKDILIVVGHKAEMIERIHGSTLYNPKFAEFNNGYSVYLALNHLLTEKNSSDEHFLILDGDLVYEKKLISDFLSISKDNALINRPISFSKDLKDEVSIIDSSGKISEFIIPTKENPLDEHFQDRDLHSYTGILKISREAAKELLEELKDSYQGWYTIPLTKIVRNHVFHSFSVPNDLKYYFDVDTREDMDKLSKTN